MKKSIERNKKLVASEETDIEALIKRDPKVTYIASKKGYWYTYENKNTLDSLTPKKGDVAFFDYEIKDLKGNVIYSELELRPQIYYVDKQNIMMGLRDGIKLMRKNEKVRFLFPSNMGGAGRLRRQFPPHVWRRPHGRGAGLGGRQRALLRPDADQHATGRPRPAPAPDRQLQETARGARQGGCRLTWERYHGHTGILVRFRQQLQLSERHAHRGAGA